MSPGEWYTCAVVAVVALASALTWAGDWRARNPPPPEPIEYLTRWWYARLILTAGRIVLIRYPWPERAWRWARVLVHLTRQLWRWRGVTYPELAHIGIKMAIRANARERSDDDGDDEG